MRLATMAVGWRTAALVVVALVGLAILMAIAVPVDTPVVAVSEIATVEAPGEVEDQPPSAAGEAADPGPSTSALIGTLVVLGALVIGLGVWRGRRRA